MSIIVDEKKINESVSFLNKCYQVSQSDMNTSSDCIEKRVSSAVDKYIALTDLDLNGERLSEYKDELKDLILEFVENTNVENDKIDSLENITKIAFSRLAKVSRDYYIEKAYGANSKKLGSLKVAAEKFKNDYRSIMNIN